MVAPSRTRSVQALLTVGPQRLVLTPPDEREFEVPFQAGAAGPDELGADRRPNTVEELGQALWRAAFSSSLGPLLDRAAARANEGGAYLMLRIVPAPDLPPGSPHWLPWEMLFDPARRDFLALTTGWSVVRGTDPFQEARTLPDRDVRVLVLTLEGQRAPSPETASIETVVGNSGQVSVEHPRDAGSVVALLRSQEADIVHVIGRGRGEGLLVGGGSTEDYLDGREVARAIHDNLRIGLVVLSASATEVVAETIARTADITVLGHRSAVRAEHAASLTETFYGRFFDGIPADVALTEARRALDRRFPGQGAWTSAVLLTSDRPPRLPARHSSTPERADPGDVPVTRAELIRQLHTTNRERILELRQVAAWKPLDDQLEEAERALQRRRPRP